MKTLTLILAAIAGSATLVTAGPESFSGKEMSQVAPVTECPKWSGFYIGAFGGYKFGDFDVDLDLFGEWNGPSPTDPFDKRVLEPRGSEDLDANGAEVGGLLGYNFQLNNWVFGLEATGAYLWLRDSEVTARFDVPNSTSIYHLSTSVKTHYLVTVGPRFGYAFCRWLPYVTGGVAFGDIDFEQQITEHDFPNQEFGEGGRSDENNVGWFAGGGLQYAITNHWSARVQYQYVDLGSTDFTVEGGPTPGYLSTHRVDVREHNASFSLMYQF
jgi:outer membrane immunogenic protein